MTGKYIFIELQWAPLPSMFRLPYNNEFFFANSGSMQLMGVNIPLINLDQHLIMLLLHHGISDLWRNLKHVFDIAVLANKYQDEIKRKQVEMDIQKWHFVKNAGVGINLCEMLFDVSLPVLTSRKSITKETNSSLDSILQYPLLEKKKKSVSNIKRQLLLTDGFYGKMLLIKGYLRTEFMPSIFDLQRKHFPPSLFPLYYVTKRFRFLLKKNKKVSGIAGN